MVSGELSHAKFMSCSIVRHFSDGYEYNASTISGIHLCCYFITIVEIFHVLIFVMMHEGEDVYVLGGRWPMLYEYLQSKSADY